MSKKITKSSGNVYADLGLENPEEHALKAELVRRIAAVMKDQDLTQTAAAQPSRHRAARCLQDAQGAISGSSRSSA